jgi:DGQHR domain-containing protein
MRGRKLLRKRVIKLTQNSSHPLFMLSLTSNELNEIADVSRISRENTGKLIGYQRPEVKRHVKDITNYLNGDNVLFPNSIILALPSTIKFIQSRGPDVSEGNISAGIIEIPIPKDNEKKPGWIVDGQQRVLALAKSNKKDLPVPVNAFIADNISLQRDQFLRINNTKPLPRGLITELLPEVSTNLPAKMANRRIPSVICDWLNEEKTSPFFELIIRHSNQKKGKGVIADNSIISMIEESMKNTSGCLFPHRNIASSETDVDGICKVLIVFWSAVKKVFNDGWGLPPNQNRLMHGVGIKSMGKLMDRVMASVDINDSKLSEYTFKEVKKIKGYCHFTEGVWEDLGNLRWNELQNVTRHVRILSNALIRHYIKTKG